MGRDLYAGKLTCRNPELLLVPFTRVRYRANCCYLLAYPLVRQWQEGEDEFQWEEDIAKPPTYGTLEESKKVCTYCMRPRANGYTAATVEAERGIIQQISFGLSGLDLGSYVTSGFCDQIP